jgi:hypothetical protein
MSILTEQAIGGLLRFGWLVRLREPARKLFLRTLADEAWLLGRDERQLRDIGIERVATGRLQMPWLHPSSLSVADVEVFHARDGRLIGRPGGHRHQSKGPD